MTITTITITITTITATSSCHFVSIEFTVSRNCLKGWLPYMPAQ